MMKRSLLAISFVMTALTSFAVRAEYTGPSAVPASTVKALQQNGRDNQSAVLRGRIIRHLQDDKYIFADDTGQMQVEIDAKQWPAQRKIDGTTVVELVGEYDKNVIEVSYFDVDEIRVP